MIFRKREKTDVQMVSFLNFGVASPKDQEEENGAKTAHS